MKRIAKKRHGAWLGLAPAASCFIGLVAVVASLAGCGSVPPDRFYTLSEALSGNPSASDAATSATSSTTLRGAAAPLSIVISAVTLPELVDRPQIVTRDSANRVNVSEQNLWAEPLKSAIGRVVAARLTETLAPARVASYPQASIAAPDLRITIDVQRMDAVPGGQAVVEALWSVLRSSDGLTRPGRTVATRQVDGVGYEEAVRAWSAALEDVSRDIGDAAKGVSTAAPREAVRKPR